MAAQRQVKKKGPPALCYTAPVDSAPHVPGRPTARIESDRLEARLRELERLFEDLKSGHASLSSFSTASSSSGSHAVPSQAPSRTPSPSPPSTGTLPAEFTPTLEENVAKLSSGLDNLELDIVRLGYISRIRTAPDKGSQSRRKSTWPKDLQRRDKRSATT